MLEKLEQAGLLIVGLATIPLAVWFGAVLTREGKPLCGLVRRHFRPIVVGLVLINLVARHYARSASTGLAHGAELLSFYSIAMMFVPMLRRLQDRTEHEMGVK